MPQENYNARCSRWWQNDITNSSSQKISSRTLSAGYKKMTDKTIRVINNTMSCIDFLFCANQNTISNELMSQSLINVTVILSLVRLTPVYQCLQYMFVKSGITVRQMWKISRK